MTAKADQSPKGQGPQGLGAKHASGGAEGICPNPVVDNKAPAALAGELRDLIAEVYQRGYNDGHEDAANEEGLDADSMHEGCAQAQADFAERLTALSIRTPTTDGLGERVEEVAQAIWGDAAYRPVGWSISAMEAVRVCLSRTPPHDTLLQLLRRAGAEIDHLSPATSPTGFRAIDTRSSAFTELPRNPVAVEIDAALSNHERTEG